MIFFLFGPDTFRSRQKLQALELKFASDVANGKLNMTRLDGEKLEAQEFEKAIATPPFLAKKRMVVVTDLIAKNKGQKIQKEILELLARNNLETTVLVFWEGDIDKKTTRSKTSSRRSNLLTKRLRDEKYAQEFNLLNPAEVTRWAAAEIKKRGGSIEAPALQLLGDLVGNDLWRLNSEIDKLLSYCNKQHITTEAVKEMVATKLDDDIFKLTDALGQKNKAVALKLIADQLQSGTAPLELHSKIIWQFRNLLLIKQFVEENGSGYTSDRLAFQLKLHPFVVKKTLAQTRQYELTQLKKTYQQLLKIDQQIKTSQTSPEVLFDLLVVKS